MTVQQKLDIFAEKVFKSVEDRRRDASGEIKDAIKIAIHEAEEEARREANDFLRAERDKYQNEANKRIHEASMVAKKEQAKLRKRVEDKLLDDLRQDLRDYIKTAEYHDSLSAGIKAAKELYGDDFKVEIDEEIGGFKLISLDKRLVFDFTFAARLRELDDDRGSIWDKRPGSYGS